MFAFQQKWFRAFWLFFVPGSNHPLCDIKKYLCSRCEIVDSVWYAVINVNAVQGLPDTNNEILVMVPPDSRLAYARAHGWLSFMSDQSYGAAKSATGFDFKLHWQLTLLRTTNALYCSDGLCFIAFYDDMQMRIVAVSGGGLVLYYCSEHLNSPQHHGVRRTEAPGLNVNF